VTYVICISSVLLILVTQLMLILVDQDEFCYVDVAVFICLEFYQIRLSIFVTIKKFVEKVAWLMLLLQFKTNRFYCVCEVIEWIIYRGNKLTVSCPSWVIIYCLIYAGPRFYKCTSLMQASVGLLLRLKWFTFSLCCECYVHFWSKQTENHLCLLSDSLFTTSSAYFCQNYKLVQCT